jgi:hypothetical protein
VTPDLNVHSFDHARPRPAPTSLVGHWLGGKSVSIELHAPTVVVAIKTECDGCRDIVNAHHDRLAGLALVVVSASDSLDDQWDQTRSSILVAPQLLEQLEVRWPPFYVVIDPTTSTVVTEGVVFGLEQVTQEISSFLSS